MSRYGSAGNYWVSWDAKRCKNKILLINYRMVWVGRSLKDHLIPTPCHGWGCLPLFQIAQSPHPARPWTVMDASLVSLTQPSMLFYQPELCVPSTSRNLPGESLVPDAFREGTSLSFSLTLHFCKAEWILFCHSLKRHHKTQNLASLLISDIPYFHYQKVSLKPWICHSGYPFKIRQVCCRKNR